MKVFATVVAAVLATMLSLYCFHRRTTSLSVFGRSLHQVEPAFDTRDVHPRSLAAAQASPTNGIRLCCGCKFDFLTVGVFLSQDDQAATLENHCGITVAASKGLSPANMPPPSTANVNVLDTAVQKDPDATPHILHGKALVIQDPSLPEHIPVAHKCGGCLVFQFDTPILPVSVGVIGMNDDLTLTIESFGTDDIILGSLQSPNDLDGSRFWIADVETSLPVPAALVSKMRICANGSFGVIFVETCHIIPPYELPSDQTTSPSMSPTETQFEALATPPSSKPTAFPSTDPSPAPSNNPSESPTVTPSMDPSEPPSAVPSVNPSVAPSTKPSEPPSAAPSTPPSVAPTDSPSQGPSNLPTSVPSARTPPSVKPTAFVSIAPSQTPSKSPTEGPTTSSSVPIPGFDIIILTDNPSPKPSTIPTPEPLEEADVPSLAPSKGTTEAPTRGPTEEPSSAHSGSPSWPDVSWLPSELPSLEPSRNPSETPSIEPQVTGTPSFVLCDDTDKRGKQMGSNGKRGKAGKAGKQSGKRGKAGKDGKRSGKNGKRSSGVSRRLPSPIVSCDDLSKGKAGGKKTSGKAGGKKGNGKVGGKKSKGGKGEGVGHGKGGRPRE